ncbi:MAG TPA: DUF58 domain-containing protein [Chloroflexota bacterium]
MALLPTWRLLALTLGVAGLLGLGALVPLALYAVPLYLGALGLLVASEARATPGRASLAVERRHDRRLSIGEPNPVELRVGWPAGPGLALRLWARDEAPPGMTVDRVVLEGILTAGGEWRGVYHLRPTRRGAYAFGDLNLRVESPRGLLRRQIRLPLAASADVFPNLRAIRRYELQLRRGRAIEAGLRRARVLGRGTEFERLRDYVPDDDYRRIAWKATARRGRPVVIEHEVERSQNVLLLIDAGRLMAAPVADLQKLDHAVNAALVLAYVAAGLGDRVGLIVFADRVEQYVPPARGRRQLHLLLTSLYRVAAAPTESDPARALLYLAARNPKRSLVVLFTDLAEASEAEGLVAQLGLIARHHLALCVMIADPELLGLAEAEPSDTRRAYERVVAQRLLDERRGVVERLERRGALVVDVPADRLSGETVGRYLEIKARTRL